MKYLLLSLLVSCASMKVPTQPPMEGTPLKSSFPVQAWTDHALKGVLASKLNGFNPSDGYAFCPKGMSPGNYVVLLAAMAKYESNYNPDTEYTENFKDRNGNYIISTGLLQLSQESARGYGCAANSQAWLRNPYNNIDCSIRILERWVVGDQIIAGSNPWQGGSRYWSVLRYKKDNIKSTMAPWCR